MEEKKLTDDTDIDVDMIVKTLGNCVYTNCATCKYIEQDNCEVNMLNDVKNLFRRLRGKISELQKQVDEYKDKIEQGTLIELPKMPFKIGDTAYWLNGLPNCIQEYKVRGYSVGRLGLRIDLGDLEPLLYKVFGEKLFCSREEAEEKLKELQK